jgi:hypothetical protein
LPFDKPFDKLKAPSKSERLRVDPERCFLTPPSKARLGAAEWVKIVLEIGTVFKCRLTLIVPHPQLGEDPVQFHSWPLRREKRLSEKERVCPDRNFRVGFVKTEE